MTQPRNSDRFPISDPPAWPAPPGAVVGDWGQITGRLQAGAWLTVDTVAMSDGTRIGRSGVVVNGGAVAMSDGI